MYNCRPRSLLVSLFTILPFVSPGTIQVEAWQPRLDDSVRQAMAGIRPDSLKGHVSFIASDLLQGRDTPSPGLDIAAEYIAAQFRRGGIEPAVKGSYFQEAPWPLKGEAKTKVRNVIGVLRGTDPFLKDSYIVVSAHYDHVGTMKEEAKDRIYNGANDDGSGTIGVVELASALASMPQKPKRSIVFALWFGEEKGLQGSRYYVENPVFPLNKTVAMVNLEQIGRTDDKDRKRVRALSMTGYDYSDLGPIFRECTRRIGVETDRHPIYSDSYFARSDNKAFADQGIPSHTLCTAFDYPDYHGVGDEWQKLDYENMAEVVRGILIGDLNAARGVCIITRRAGGV